MTSNLWTKQSHVGLTYAVIELGGQLPISDGVLAINHQSQIYTSAVCAGEQYGLDPIGGFLELDLSTC